MTTDRHRAPPGDQELLYDPSIPTPAHAERARTLAARLGTGTLCTVAREPAGYPYGSFVTFALERGAPVFLISELAEHTRNLLADPRASLLMAEPGEGEPLARGRVTLLGRVRCLGAVGADDPARRAYLAAHPGAANYVDFGDFAFWRLEVEAVRYIGGFGRMSWVAPAEWTAAEPDPIAPHAAAILEHMNADHGAAMIAYCRAFSRAGDVSAARMTGVDRYGVELSATTAAGPRPIRIAFDAPVAGAEEVRAALVALARRARGELG